MMFRCIQLIPDPKSKLAFASLASALCPPLKLLPINQEVVASEDLVLAKDIRYTSSSGEDEDAKIEKIGRVRQKMTTYICIME